MLLSVIIVNYNVKYFVEQCLFSVQKAIGDMDAEIIVVDNYSSDFSMEYLQPRHRWITYIANNRNLGFSKGSNQALKEAVGKYILFINPDTIIAEDTLSRCIEWMEDNPKTGAVGVRMIDGKGKFLKECRRGFPTPWVSFCKIVGLTALFPGTRLFGYYYLGHLNKNRNHPVDALSGAYMMVRKEILDRHGAFDEQFFMYAEDIDLSYRIRQAGYVNYYLADTTIIHFKGESTKRNLEFVQIFYKAMSQFVQKHYKNKLSSVFLSIIEGGIWLRSVLAGTVGLFHVPNGVQPASQQKRTAICVGDENTFKETQSLFTSRYNRINTDDPGKADEIIFCEGPAYSFKKIITQFQQIRTNASLKVHAAGSESIVGSDVRDLQGEAIEISVTDFDP